VDIQAEEDIGALIFTLEKMKKVFETCRLEGDENNMIKSIPQMLTISYTETEETWLRNQFGQFQSQFTSVVPPKDYFDQLISLLLYDTPISETFVATWFGMIIERYRRVLKIHPGRCHNHGRPQTFFRGGQKYIQRGRGGQKHTF
jgi:hypothetical protein